MQSPPYPLPVTVAKRRDAKPTLPVTGNRGKEERCQAHLPVMGTRDKEERCPSRVTAITPCQTYVDGDCCLGSNRCLGLLMCQTLVWQGAGKVAQENPKGAKP